MSLATEVPDGRPYSVTVEAVNNMGVVIEDAVVTSYGLMELLRTFGNIPYSARRSFTRRLQLAGELSMTTPPTTSRRYHIRAKARDV